MKTMPSRRFEPLFAQNERLWLRIWVATQAAALAAACILVVDGAHGVRHFLASRTAPPSAT